MVASYWWFDNHFAQEAKSSVPKWFQLKERLTSVEQAKILLKILRITFTKAAKWLWFYREKHWWYFYVICIRFLRVVLNLKFCEMFLNFNDSRHLFTEVVASGWECDIIWEMFDVVVVLPWRCVLFKIYTKPLWSSWEYSVLGKKLSIANLKPSLLGLEISYSQNLTAYSIHMFMLIVPYPKNSQIAVFRIFCTDPPRR